MLREFREFTAKDNVVSFTTSGKTFKKIAVSMLNNKIIPVLIHIGGRIFFSGPTSALKSSDVNSKTLNYYSFKKITALIQNKEDIERKIEYEV